MFSEASPPFWDLRGRLGIDGVIHLWGYETFFGVNDPASGEGLLIMPGAGPLADMFYCAASVDVANVAFARSTAQIGDITELGQCPAQPGAGQLSGCFGTAAGAAIACGATETRLIGTLGATDLDESFEIDTHNSVGTATTTTRFLMFGHSGMITLFGSWSEQRVGISYGLSLALGVSSVTPATPLT